MTEAPAMAAMRALQRHLIDQLVLSIKGAASPEKAAEYVTNRLTVHEKDLLAQVAVTFAYDEVKKLLNDGPTLAERHQRHYQTCDCLGDKAICCDPTCPCHDDLPSGKAFGFDPAQRDGTGATTTE